MKRLSVLTLVLVFNFLSCSNLFTPPLSILDKLALYGQTFEYQSDRPTITDSAGNKIINYTIYYNSPNHEEEIIFPLMAMTKGLAIQECILPTEPQKFYKVNFIIINNGETFIEYFYFVYSTSQSNRSMAEKAKSFFLSNGQICTSYLGQKDKHKIHFLLSFPLNAKPDQLSERSYRCALFTRYFILDDSARHFNEIFYHYTKPNKQMIHYAYPINRYDFQRQYK